MQSSSRSPLRCYGVALGAVIAATLVRFLLDPVLGDRHPFAIYFAAIAVAVWYGGARPAALTVVLSGFCADWFFLTPRHTLKLPIVDVATGVDLFVFALVGIVLVVFGDKRLQSEEALRRQQELLRQITDAVPALISYIDTEHCYRLNNRQYELWFGQPRESLLGRHMRDVLGAGAYERLRGYVEEALAGREVTYEDYAPYKSGPRHIRATYVPHVDQDGQVQGLFVMVADITERKQAEAALRASEEEFRSLFELAGSGVAQLNPATGGYVRVNRKFCEITGYSAEELAATTYSDITHPDDRQRDREVTEPVLCGEKSAWAIEKRYVRKDGTVVWVQVTGTLIRDADARPQRSVAMIQDITDRKRAEASLRLLADAGVVLAALVDPKSTLQKVARLAVPWLADWCLIDICGDDGQFQRVALSHVDSSTELRLMQLPVGRAAAGTFLAPMVHAFSSGEIRLVSPGSPSRYGPESSVPGAQEFCPQAFLAVPLVIRGRVVGVMGFGRTASARGYDAADVDLADELARRAAVALDNAQLYQTVLEADRRKDIFLAMLAHEMRNPLAAISGALALMRRPESQGQLDWIRNVLERQTNYLVHLIDDLLDVSRISEGKLQLKKEPVELGEIIRRAAEDVGPLISDRNHQLQVHLAAEPMPVLGDATRLEQILVNLLNNAAKYTDPGGTIRVTAEREADQIVVHVCDNGIGIAPEMLPGIFGLFNQIDKSLDRSRGGMGIGLALVSRLTEMHGGQISASSDGPGKGSQFTIRLPVLDQPVTPPPAVSTETSVLKQGTKVLVVEDNQDAAKTLGLMLQQAGGIVETAYDGQAALKMAEDWRPEAVLLDLGLPEMDGFEVARRMRNILGLERCLLIAISGHGQPEDRLRATKAGFDHYLLKPIDMPVLFAILSELGSEPHQPPTQESPLVKKPTPYRVLVIDDSTLIAQLTAMELEEKGHEVRVAHDGPSGLATAHKILPEVVLCDISLQGEMDGYAVARALREHPATQSAVLIAVTGYDDEEYVRRAKEAGFDDLLPKPLDSKRLHEILASRKTERRSGSLAAYPE